MKITIDDLRAAILNDAELRSEFEKRKAALNKAQEDLRKMEDDFIAWELENHSFGVKSELEILVDKLREEVLENG